MTDVSVVIPARNAAATIGRTLSALGAQQTDASYEVIVVDDGSTDDTIAIARAAGARVLEQHAQGPAQARNLGRRSANAGVLAFTDADCYPDPGWVEAALAAVAGADFVQGAVRPERDPGVFEQDADGRPQVRSLGVGEHRRAARPVRAASAASRSGSSPRSASRSARTCGSAGAPFGPGAAAVFDAAVSVEHAVFPRGPAGYVDERRRLRYFPPAAKQMPELRDGFFYRGVFLSPATADVRPGRARRRGRGAAPLAAAAGAGGAVRAPRVRGARSRTGSARRSSPRPRWRRTPSGSTRWHAGSVAARTPLL